MPLDTTTHIKQ